MSKIYEALQLASRPREDEIERPAAPVEAMETYKPVEPGPAVQRLVQPVTYEQPVARSMRSATKATASSRCRAAMRRA